jgi:hypothetical protein
MICRDCGEIMIKSAIQNEEGDWRVAWLCDCEMPKDVAIDSFGDYGIQLTIHNGDIYQRTVEAMGGE